MKKRLGIVALIGVAVGTCWVLTQGAVFNQSSPLRPPWQAIMWASCPPIWAVRTAWWLVPILNGVLYAGIAISVQVFREFISPFAS